MPTVPLFVGRKDIVEKLLSSIRSGQAAFWISGPAGIGKTYLIEHLRQCVINADIKRQYDFSDINCLFAQTDHRQRDAPEVMNKLLSDLDKGLRRRGGSSHQRWRDAYEGWRRTYRGYEDLLRRAESDLGAPTDLRRTLALLTVDAMSVLAPIAITASGYPAVGAALANIAQLGNGVKDFLGHWFEAYDEARKELLYQPIQELTPEFRDVLKALYSDSVRVVLILDEYEQTCTFLEPWLTLLFDDDFLQRFRLAILISSQYSLPRDSELQYYAEFDEIRLKPFDLEETKRFLSPEYWVHSEYIYQQSGGLPLLVEALVQAGSPPGAQTTYEVRAALHRLDQSTLKLIKDDSLKRLARLCAVPRELNEDVFRDVQRFALNGCDGDVQEVVGKATIKWLESQPFVEDWRYDPTVRTILLRNLRNRSPRDYENLNLYLEEICAEEIQKRDLSGREWCEARTRRWYHGLAASPRKSLAKALTDFVESLDKYYHPGDPPGTIAVLDIVSILEDLLKVRQDEEAFRLWSDYVSSFHKDVEDDVSGEKRDEYDLELCKQLIEFHYHHDLRRGDVRRRAYQDYDGFANAQVIDCLKRYGKLLCRVKRDYGEAYEQFLKALREGDQDARTPVYLFSMFILLARENSTKALDYLRENGGLLNRMLPQLPQGLANKFNKIREELLNAQ